jgi:hypothetical protein
MTEFRSLPGTGPTVPQYGPPSEASRGVQAERAATRPQAESEPDGLLQWLGSSEARRFEGRWVLLNDEFDVLDHARTLTELAQRNRDARTPIIVFVDPANTTFIG